MQQAVEEKSTARLLSKKSKKQKNQKNQKNRRRLDKDENFSIELRQLLLKVSVD